MTINLILLAAFVVLQILDGYSTYKVLQLGGRETNGILAKCMERFGVIPTLIVAKSAAIVAVGFMASQETIDGMNPMWMLIAPIVVIYAYVVSNNFRALKELREKVGG